MTKNIEQINQRFKQLGGYLIAWRWAIIAALLLINGIAVIGIRHIRLSTSYDDWFFKDDPLVAATDRFEEIFGDQGYVAVLIEAGDVFAPEVLRIIRDIGEELVDRVPYADDILSLTEFEFTRGTDEGVEIGNIVPEEIPQNPEEIETIRALAFSKPYWVNRLFSDDSKESWGKIPDRQTFDLFAGYYQRYESGDARRRSGVLSHSGRPGTYFATAAVV